MKTIALEYPLRFDRFETATGISDYEIADASLQFSVSRDGPIGNAIKRRWYLRAPDAEKLAMRFDLKLLWVPPEEPASQTSSLAPLYCDIDFRTVRPPVGRSLGVMTRMTSCDCILGRDFPQQFLDFKRELNLTGHEAVFVEDLIELVRLQSERTGEISANEEATADELGRDLLAALDRLDVIVFKAERPLSEGSFSVLVVRIMRKNDPRVLSPTQLFERWNLLLFKGKKAVYRGTGFLSPVVIEEVRFEHQGRPFFELKLVPIDGIMRSFSDNRRAKTPAPSPAFTSGAVWSSVWISWDAWSVAMSGCCWRVLHGEAACDAVVQWCKNAPLEDPAILFRAADYLCANPAIIQEAAETKENLYALVCRRARLIEH